MGLIAFLILLPIVVFVHEFGHFIFARINGVEVEAFSIGFGKVLFKWKDRYGTQWRISAIPLGGYVKMLGQSDTPESSEKKSDGIKKLSPAMRKKSFEFKRRYQKASIVVAGPLFNFIFAFVVFFGIFFSVGVPNMPAIVNKVVDGSAAFRAGIISGDKVIKMNKSDIVRSKDISKFMSKSDGSKIDIKIEREGKVISKVLTPQKSGEKYLMGISYMPVFDDYRRVGLFSSIKEAYLEIADIVSQTLGSIGEMLIGERSSKELGGIISIAQISGEALSSGFYSFLYLMAFISVSLGLFNLFPIPVLDGGYLFIFAIEGILGRDLKEKTKEKMFFVGFMFIIFLLLLSNVNDIIRLFK